MKRVFSVPVREVCEATVTVEAGSLEEALQLVMEMDASAFDFSPPSGHFTVLSEEAREEERAAEVPENVQFWELPEEKRDEMLKGLDVEIRLKQQRVRGAKTLNEKIEAQRAVRDAEKKRHDLRISYYGPAQ